MKQQVKTKTATADHTRADLLDGLVEFALDGEWKTGFPTIEGWYVILHSRGVMRIQFLTPPTEPQKDLDLLPMIEFYWSVPIDLANVPLAPNVHIKAELIDLNPREKKEGI